MKTVTKATNIANSGQDNICCFWTWRPWYFMGLIKLQQQQLLGI